MPKLVPNLWFDDQALEAAEFYCSIFPRSEVLTVTHYTDAGPGEPGTVLTVDFRLDGQKLTGINGGPLFTFSEAVSLLIECKDQAELDHYWDALTADGGAESQCGWLKDKYGFSWQVVTEGWERYFVGDDLEAISRATKAMFSMTKIDVAEIERAFNGG